jgi:hypothetical protein
MKLTKDEARILAVALGESKYDFVSEMDKPKALETIIALNDLEKRLEDSGIDIRRGGRTSRDDWRDMLKRFVKKFNSKKE